jgi:O-methyltransferase involved in polyketide biosynthesis
VSAGAAQVVVVAAGFDTRAYRIGSKHSSVKFFEVDLPHASQ